MGVEYTPSLLPRVVFPVLLWLCALIFISDCYAEPYDGRRVIGVVEDVSANVTSVCDVKGCNCTPAQSNSWMNVNCTFNNKQVSGDCLRFVFNSFLVRCWWIFLIGSV